MEYLFIMKVKQISNIMNPLVLFDYIYYSIANFYSSVFDLDDQKRFAGLGLLSIFQSCNCITLYRHFNLENHIDIGVVNIYIFFCAVMLALNFIRYYKFISLPMLENKWQKDKLYIKLIKILFTVSYIILSVALL